MQRECKRCLLLESAEGDMLQLIKEKIEKLSPEERASQDVYEQRLSVCKDCEQLISGMCLKCGCYVEFRAAFKDKRCPDSKGGRWKV
ncbi:MAG: hypothetical protein IIX14_01990 [Clostridia bacterium]|jgi:hypothetical protein|nr:hypothetical protein [Clostridia bacterium]